MGTLSHLSPFLLAVERALDSESLPQIKSLFRLDNPLLHQALFALDKVHDAQLKGACASKLDAPWHDVVSKHLRAAQARADGDSAGAFALYIADEGPLKTAKAGLVAAPDSMSAAAMLEQIIGNSVLLARETDKLLGLAEEDSKFKALGGALQPMAHDLGGHPRADQMGRFRAGLALTITLTQVYTKLNNMQGCMQLAKTFNERYTPSIMRVLPASTRVTAYYYLGRTEVSSGNLPQGLKLLDQAFLQCKADSKNVNTILRFIVPLKMLQGLLPSEQLLQQYGLSHYLPVHKAMATGDVGLFERSMQELTLKMVSEGTYLLWDMLIFHVYRRLVKRIIDFARPTREEKVANHLPLDVMLGVLQQQGVSTNMDQLECMLTVSISSKYIKGYISNKQKVLVLSKADAFPEATPEWWTPMTASNAL